MTKQTAIILSILIFAVVVLGLFTFNTMRIVATHRQALQEHASVIIHFHGEEIQKLNQSN